MTRFVLAALLKHTALLGQGCGEGRYVAGSPPREAGRPEPNVSNLPVRYQPSKSLAELYWNVYKVRNRLLACKNMDFIQTRSSSRERRVSVRPVRALTPLSAGR